MIPEEKNAGVSRALRETFGVTEFEDIHKMTTGLSSDLVFRIVVHGSPYLLRIMTRIDERMDPSQHLLMHERRGGSRCCALRPIQQRGRWNLNYRFC